VFRFSRKTDVLRGTDLGKGHSSSNGLGTRYWRSLEGTEVVRFHVLKETDEVFLKKYCWFRASWVAIALQPSSGGIHLHTSIAFSEFAADRSSFGMKSQQSTVKAPINPVKPGDPITSTTSHGLNVCPWSECDPWRGTSSAASSSLQSSVCRSAESPPLRFDEPLKVPLLPVSN